MRIPKLTRRFLFQLFAGLFLIECLLFGVGFIPIDWYFMVPTGKYILSNGFPTVNPWFVLEEPVVGSPYVIQQWLYCLYAVFIDKFKLYLPAMLLMIALIVLVMLKLAKLKNIPKKDTILAIMLSLWASKNYMFSLRPEALTILLLLCEIYCLERISQIQSSDMYKRLKPKLLKYTLIIIALQILEANLHSSMWMFHFCVLLAYLVPFVGKQARVKLNAETILMILGMMGGVICSPIGIHAVTYVFNALISNTFDLIEVVEMAGMSAGIIKPLMLVLLMFYWNFSRGTLKISSVWLMLGFSVAMAMQFKNTMFMPVAIYMAFTDILEDRSFMEVTYEPAPFMKMAVTVFVFCGLQIFIDASYTCIDNGYWRSEYPMYTIHNAMLEIQAREDDWQDVHVFTTCESGSYLEYSGFKHVYLDARPEMFNRKGLVDENMSVLEEFNIYCRAGVDFDGNEITDADITEQLSKYEFEYYFIDNTICPRLHTYLEANAQSFELVGNYNSLLLYHTKG